jgi:hypothetical protein
MVLIQILEQVVNGLLVGAYYLLIALGLSLIFSLGGLVNPRRVLCAGRVFRRRDRRAGPAVCRGPPCCRLIGLVVERS